MTCDHKKSSIRIRKWFGTRCDPYIWDRSGLCGGSLIHVTIEKYNSWVNMYWIRQCKQGLHRTRLYIPKGIFTCNEGTMEGRVVSVWMRMYVLGKGENDWNCGIAWGLGRLIVLQCVCGCLCLWNPKCTHFHQFSSSACSHPHLIRSPLIQSFTVFKFFSLDTLTQEKPSLNLYPHRTRRKIFAYFWFVLSEADCTFHILNKTVGVVFWTTIR